MKDISMIAAIGKRRELGKDNQLLWHIPEANCDGEKYVSFLTKVITSTKTYCPNTSRNKKQRSNDLP